MVFHSMKRNFVTPQKVFTKIREFVRKFEDGFQFTIEIDYCRTDTMTTKQRLHQENFLSVVLLKYLTI